MERKRKWKIKWTVGFMGSMGRSREPWLKQQEPHHVGEPKKSDCFERVDDMAGAASATESQSGM